MLYPLTMFCCGCSVPVGVGIILTFHLTACLGYVASVCSNVILHSPGFASTWSLDMQMLGVAFSLIGLAAIVSAMWGVVHRVETNIRLYLYYLMLCFVLDSAALVYYCLVEDPCRLAGDLVAIAASNYGEAFLCGTFRTMSYFAAAAGIAVLVYCLWVVWSFCEDVHDGKNGPELWQLLPTRDEVFTKRRTVQGSALDTVGAGQSSLPGAQPYGAISAECGSTIFSGDFHETSYPPREASYPF